MMIDQPIIVYDDDKKKENGKREFTAPTSEAMDKAKLQWEEIKRKRAAEAAEKARLEAEQSKADKPVKEKKTRKRSNKPKKEK